MFLNLLKTIILFFVISIIFTLFGGLLDVILGKVIWSYLMFLFSCIFIAFLYLFSEKIILILSGAKPLDLVVYNDFNIIVKEVAAKCASPLPRIFITNQLQANLFTAGRSPGHSSLIITQSLLNVLQRDELLAILAHEFAHIKRYDTLIGSLSAVYASIVLYPAYIKLSRDASGEGQRLFFLVEAIMQIFIFLGLFVVRFGMPRGKEFAADKKSANIMESGRSLASALQKISDSAANSPISINPIFYSLYIYDPMGGTGGKYSEMFLTHPPLERRLDKLSSY